MITQPNYKYRGWLQYIKSTQETLFLPFICQRCGKCCTIVSVETGYFNPLDIAKYLNLSAKDVIEKYLGEPIKLSEDNIRWRQTKPSKPCMFLEQNQTQNTCKIYDIRPGPCEAYPIYTDHGDSGIRCPGRVAFVRAAKKIGRGYIWNYDRYSSDKEPPTIVKPKKWPKHLSKYLATDPTKEALEIFIKTNEPKSKQKFNK